MLEILSMPLDGRLLGVSEPFLALLETNYPYDRANGEVGPLASLDHQLPLAPPPEDDPPPKEDPPPDEDEDLLTFGITFSTEYCSEQL